MADWSMGQAGLEPTGTFGNWHCSPVLSYGSHNPNLNLPFCPKARLIDLIHYFLGFMYR